MFSDTYNFKFIEGAISENEMSSQLLKNKENTSVGASSVFVGTIRKDQVADKFVKSITYTANKELAETVMKDIIEKTKEKFNTESICVFHSLGEVYTGEICLLVLINCKHRSESFKAVEFLVERLKKELPVWGKEILEDNSYNWKINN